MWNWLRTLAELPGKIAGSYDVRFRAVVHISREPAFQADLAAWSLRMNPSAAISRTIARCYLDTLRKHLLAQAAQGLIDRRGTPAIHRQPMTPPGTCFLILATYHRRYFSCDELRLTIYDITTGL